MCPVLLFLTKALSVILATLRRGRFTEQTSQTILRRCPSSDRPLTSRRDGISPCASEDLPIMFSGSATTAEIFTIPFLVWSSATCPKIISLSSSHSDPRTMPRLSEHPRRQEPCWRFRDLRVTTVHPALLNASRSPGG